MADKKFSELDPLGDPLTGADAIAVVRDPGGAPSGPELVTLTQLLAFLGGGGGGGSGCIVQRKRAVINAEQSTNATIPNDDTLPQNTEGAALANVAITVTDAANDVLVRFVAPEVSADGGVRVQFALFRDAGANAVNAGAVSITSIYLTHSYVLEFYDPAPGAGAHTYYLRWGGDGGNCRLNMAGSSSQYGANVPIAYLTAEEFVP